MDDVMGDGGSGKLLKPSPKKYGWACVFDVWPLSIGLEPLNDQD
ncbi:MAG: hypothetical protein QM711_12640 [Micropruina sp.]